MRPASPESTAAGERVSPAVRIVVRALDGLGLALAALTAVIILTGGFTVAGAELTRAEDIVLAGVVVLALRAGVRPIELPACDPKRAAVAAVLFYAASFAFISVTRHMTFQTHALDLGYYVQVVWSIGQGRGAWVSLPEMHAWGDHFSPVLYLFVPIAWLVPGAIALLLGQTLILAAGGLAVFAFARQRLEDERLAAGFALLYLLNPTLHGINIRDVHPQAFAIALLIGAAYAFDRRRYGWCAVALALTAAAREDAAVAVVGFGVWLALARRKWLLGGAVAAASIGLLMVDIHWLIPYWRGGPYRHFGRYQHLGRSFEEVLASPITRPRVLLATVLTAVNARYLVLLLAPLGFLPLFAPRALLAALPGLSINLLSLDRVLIVHRSQYQSFILPFLVLAAIEGYRALGTMASERRLFGRSAPGAVLAFAVLASIGLTSRTVNELMITRWWPHDRIRAAHRLIARVPPMVSVSTNERFVPHLATRPQVFITKEQGLTRGEWVLGTEAVIGDGNGLEVIARDGGYVLARTARAKRG